MKFNDFLTEETILDQEVKIQTLLFLCEQNLLTESEEDLVEGVHKHLEKAGLKLHKSKGLFSYIKSFTTGAGKVILALIKGDKEKAKKIVQTLEKKDVLDFLYKLDLGTLHIITGPLHMIDAWTGWDLSVQMKKKVSKSSDIIDVVKKAIQKVKMGIDDLFKSDKPRHDKLYGYMNVLDQEIA